AHQGANLARIKALAHAGPQHRLSLLSEDPAHARALRELGLGVFLDLDPGYHRTGVPLQPRARIDSLLAAAGSSLRGLHCYDGHLHDGTPTQRQAQAQAVYDQLLAFARTLPGRPELITSGTPTFPFALAYAPLRTFDHTVSPGTVVYWDARSQQLGIDGFECAVQVLARVISAPQPDRITLDAGSKAIDAAAGDPCAEALGPWRLRALTPSEEHLPMQVLGAAPPLGTLLRLVPRHVCPTVNLYDDAVLLEGDTIAAVVPVRARGHACSPQS
ncbi:MAG TPA: D-TA family PLP-dependent enzyme, partial [Planctomycetota bacterium]|nr:D-TA family PLP-dependent enzyme [Planctomycetota bacterium]